jgi:hypothetical protein
MRRYRPLALILGVLAPSGIALGQKTPDRPPIDLSPPAPVEQPSKGDPFSGSITGGWGVPVGAFHHNEDGGIDLNFHGAYALDPGKHLALRLDGGFLAYGYVSHDLDVPAYDENGFVGYQNVSYAVRQHQMYSLDLGPEVTALSGSVRPYGFATAGLSYFLSQVNLRPPQYAGDEPLDHTVFSSGNFAWSTGLGLRIGFHDARSGLFDVGIRFRRNARARYANDKALSTQSDGTLNVTPFYGSANLITLYAGFWVGPKQRRP